MNILLVTDTYLPYITGVSVSTDSIARYMVSRGHKVTIVNPKPIVKGKLELLENLKIVNVPSIPFSLYNKNAVGIFPFAMPILNKLLKKEKFNVVHIQEPNITGFSTLIVAKRHHLPIVGAFHFIPQQMDKVIWGGSEKILTPILNAYIKFIYNKYDKIMTVSNYFANYLRSHGVKREITVVSNGVDTNLYKPAPKNLSLRNKLGISESDIVFMILGRIDGDKNVETLVRAMPYTDKNVKLLVIGKGRKKEMLQDLSRQQKIDQRIIWVDYITNEEMPDYYHASDVFSIMSQFEGQSIVTLQAVASGLPVIVANACALPELCLNGKNGFLVSVYDYKTLAEKMNLLAKDKNLREKFGAESRKISLPHHKPKALHKLEEMYESLI